MIFNYFKIAIRNVLRYKSFSLINLFGLTLGLMVFLSIALFVIDEFSFDRYHEKKDRIYRAIISAEFDGQVNTWPKVPNLLAPTVKENIAEVETAARYFHHDFGDLAFLSNENDKFSETQLFYADPELFSIFSIDLLKGNAANALSRPGTVVLSESASRKYFPGTDPIGKVLTVNNKLELEVTGVYKDFPGNSSLKANLIASFSSHWFGQDRNRSWGNASFESYFLLHEGIASSVVEAKIDEMLAKHIEKDNRWFTISLQPLTDMHLKSGDLKNAFDTNAAMNIDQVNILIALAVFILLIASINYMNLATAQSQRRNKEVGISKTLGATSNQLSGKFYFETGLFVFCAMLVSLGLFTIVLPQLNVLTGKQITTHFLYTGWFWMGFMGIGLVLTLLAGSYPAWYLSSFSPKAALQKKTSAGAQVTIRKGLVVFQFAVSMVLIISSIVFYRQMSYIQNKKLGYEPEQVIAVMTSAASDQLMISSLKTEFESMADVRNVSRSQSYPGIGSSGYSIRKDKDAQTGASIVTNRVTHEIVDVLGLKILAGRTLPENKDPQDTTIQVILNKSALEYLQLTPEEAIGTSVYIFNRGPAEIVGVVDDFHYSSLHQKIGPYAFNNNNDNRYNYLLIKVETANLMETIARMEKVYKNLVPAAFEYTFIDEKMAALYQSEQKLADVILAASGIAIFIACLGLYALAAFTAEQRTKEIGIRKVMGASVPQLVSLLSKDFLKLVVVAIAVGIPVGYYLMDRWLEGFAYKTSIGIMIFALAAGISLLIAWFTVSVESIKAAVTNPVKSLRNE